MELLKKIEALIEEPLVAQGYAIVRLRFSGARYKVLQVMIERLDEVMINVDDCSAVSRLVSALMDEHDPIKDPYSLEVSSPGLERPLVKARDYQRFCGASVIISTLQAVNERKRFQGRLLSATDKEIVLDLRQNGEGDEVPVTLGLENIRAARLFADFNNSKPQS